MKAIIYELQNAGFSTERRGNKVELRNEDGVMVGQLLGWQWFEIMRIVWRNGKDFRIVDMPSSRDIVIEIISIKESVSGYDIDFEKQYLSKVL